KAPVAADGYTAETGRPGACRTLPEHRPGSGVRPGGSRTGARLYREWPAVHAGRPCLSGGASNEALVQALLQDVARQVDADEDHAADAWFALGPLGAQVAAHELVHALEDHLARRALHVKHALVAQHARAVDV